MDCPPVSPGGGSEVPEALLEPGVGAGLTGSPWCRWAAHRERARGGAKPGGAGRESGRGGDGGRSQLCSGDPHCGWEGTGSVAGAGRRGAGVGSWRGWGRASPWSSRGSPWRLGTPTACAPGSPRSGIQWARRRGADHRSGNWDCVEQGTTRSEEHTSELQSPPELVCRLLLEKKKINLSALGPKTTKPTDDMPQHTKIDK